MTVWDRAGILERLKTLCAEALSNAEVARILSEEFKVSLTRNAIIGKRLRIGLVSRKGKAVRVAGVVTVGGRGPRARNVFLFTKQPKRPSVNATVLALPTSFPHACDLLSLNNTSCRFPIGDVGSPGFFFCGVPQADLSCNRPYCYAHSIITTQRRG
jgi:GcrA cell cycle regulator